LKIFGGLLTAGEIRLAAKSAGPSLLFWRCDHGGIWFACDDDRSMSSMAHALDHPERHEGYAFLVINLTGGAQ
jgi:hypothetical protein